MAEQSTHDSMAWPLERFVAAQAAVYETVVAELARGKKTSHWMWFVFPQLKALGRSPTAKLYGLASACEALAYWHHPLLGKRLAECIVLMLSVAGASAHEVLGSPDDLKFQSCLTLFAHIAPEEQLFVRALQRFYGGQRDERTVLLLEHRG